MAAHPARVTTSCTALVTLTSFHPILLLGCQFVYAVVRVRADGRALDEKAAQSSEASAYTFMFHDEPLVALTFMRRVALTTVPP